MDAVEILSRAAQLMRKQARLASTGEPWESSLHYDALFTVDLKPSLGPTDGLDDENSYLVVMGVLPYEAPRFLLACHEHADHIAAWYPAVALAVADTLDCAAQSAEPTAHLLAVAWAYLRLPAHDHGTAAADACPSWLVDLPCGCQDVHYACGYVDREHDHVECLNGGVRP